MKVLAIDTCGPEGSLALAEVAGQMTGQMLGQDLRVMAQRTLAGRTYSELLLLSIRELLESEAVSLKDLGCMVVVRGPGSFTGVRVAISTAKGLAQGAGLPVIGLSRLQVLAHAAGSRAAVLDAGRGEIYFGLAGHAGDEALLNPEEVRARLAETELVCCEEMVARCFPGSRRVAAPTAEDALRLALPRLRREDFDGLATMDAHYLRRTQAEVVAAGASR